MLRFIGSLEELQEIVTRCALLGDWQLHAKSNCHRFRASTGAILNWWPTTGTINFQGHDAEQFEMLLFEHAIVGVAQSEPGVACEEESAWEAVPGPTQTHGGSREEPSFAGETAGRWVLSPRRAWLQDQSSFSPLLIRNEGLDGANHGQRRYLGVANPRHSCSILHPLQELGCMGSVGVAVTGVRPGLVPRLQRSVP